MAKKPQKPDSNNNNKKTKPKKDRAFLFGSKKWSADEYFGGEDDFDFINDNSEVNSNNSYFADEEESNSRRKRITPYIARKESPKESSSFISDKDIAQENDVSLLFDAENIKENTIAEEAEQNSETVDVINEEPKKKHIEYQIDNLKEELELVDVEEKQEFTEDVSDYSVTSNKPSKRKSHAGLLSKIGDVEFKETELPEEILSEEDFLEETAEPIETPKKRSGLFARFEKDDQALTDEIKSDETAEKESSILKKKEKGLFSLKNKENTVEEFAEDELNETAIESDILEDDSLEDKTRSRRKDHTSLLASIEQVEFEETKLPEEMLVDEAAADYASKTQVKQNEKRKGLFARLEDKDTERNSNEFVDKIEEDEKSEKAKKRSFISNFLKEEPNDLLDDEEVKEIEASLPFKEDLDPEVESKIIKDDSQEKDIHLRRKDHSSLLASLEQVEFEETELPEEVLVDDAAVDNVAETQEEPSEKSKGLFARFEDKDTEGKADEFVDAIGDDDKSDITRKRSFLSNFLKDDKPNDLLDDQQNQDSLPFNEEIAPEPQQQFEDIQEEKISARRKDHSNLLASLNEVTFAESDVPEEVLIEEASQENEALIEEPKKRRGLFGRIEETTSEDYLDTEEIVADADVIKDQPEENQSVRTKRVDDGVFAAAESFYFEGKKKDDSSDEKINNVEEPVPLQSETEIKGSVDEEFSSDLSIDTSVEKETNEPIAHKKKIGWFRRFFYRDLYDEELIDEDDFIEEDKSLNSNKRHSGLSAYFYSDDEFDETAIDVNTASNKVSEQKTEGRRSRTFKNEKNHKAEEALEDFAEETQLEEPRAKRGSHFTRSEETYELDEAVWDDVYSAPGRSRANKKRNNKRVSTKQVDLEEITAGEYKHAVKPAAASISSLQEEEIEPKKRTRKPVGRRDNSASILAAIKNILPRRKSDNKALTFAEVNKHNKKIKTRRIFIYAGTGILAVAVALVFIFVPLGKPVDTQPDDTMVAISDAVETEEPTQEPTDVPTTEPSPTQQVVQTPIVTTQPDPTHRTINIDKMVDDFKVEADLYYNKVGYSTNYYKYTDNEMYILAQLIHGEARGESLDGMVAVGNVVMNRVLNRRVFGNNIKSVVTAAHQFSGYKSSIVPSSKCKIAARKVLDFQVWVVPQNIYYFKAYGTVGSDWGSHKYYTKIGGHYFYTHKYGGRSNTGKVPPRMFERTYMWPRMGCKPEERVYMIQYMLNGLGYDVKADSYFGEGTMEELKKFQEKKGLDSDGVAGPTTIEALIRAYGIENFYDKFYT